MYAFPFWITLSYWSMWLYLNFNLVEMYLLPKVLCHELIWLVSQTSCHLNLLLDSFLLFPPSQLILSAYLSSLLWAFLYIPTVTIPSGLWQLFSNKPPLNSVVCFQNRFPKYISDLVNVLVKTFPAPHCLWNKFQTTLWWARLFVTWTVSSFF